MIERTAGEAPCVIAADKAYDTHGFVAQLRQISATPHVAQNIERNGGSAIDGRTTRHAGCALSLKARKLIEETVGRRAHRVAGDAHVTGGPIADGQIVARAALHGFKVVTHDTALLITAAVSVGNP
jgi:hypothetical protein